MISAKLCLPIFRIPDKDCQGWQTRSPTVQIPTRCSAEKDRVLSPSSSIGVSRAADEAAYQEAVDAAFVLDEKVAVEEAIVGVEVGCAIVGDVVHGTSMGEPDEIVVSGDGFFRIHLEKNPGENTQLRCPAELPADVMDRVRAAGTAVYEALGCEGLARVDLFVTPEGEVVFNEVNSMPGLTYYSRFPQMMRVAGRELGDVLVELVEGCLVRE